MSANKEESLSPDEMRQKLYQTFKSRGLLDALKVRVSSHSVRADYHYYIDKVNIEMFY